MCVRSCDCNNCYKRKRCTWCEHFQYVNQFLNVNCYHNGVQGCIFRIPFKSNTGELKNESSNNRR